MDTLRALVCFSFEIAPLIARSPHLRTDRPMDGAAAHRTSSDISSGVSSPRDEAAAAAQTVTAAALNSPGQHHVRPVTPAEHQRNLQMMLWDVACYSVMVGLGEQYLSAFAIALGLSDTISGWITTIPLLAGAALQMISPWAIRKLGSHRLWCVGCVGVQGLSFIPLVIAAAWGQIPTWLLFVIASFYWGAGLAAGPAWNAWVNGILPVGTRSGFLARRSRVGQVTLLLAFVCGGLLLQAGKASNNVLTVFTALFAIAGACRMASTWCLYVKTEPAPPRRDMKGMRLAELRGLWRKGQPGPLLAYLWIMYASAQIAGPFFTPYLLNDMQCDYAVYMLVIGISFAAKALIMPFAGRFAERYGVRRLLILSGLAIIPLPVLWVCSREIWFLLVIQIAAGASWGAFELAIVLIFLESIPVDRRTSILTLYNAGYALANVGGSLIGGALLAILGSTTAAYFWIFAVSGAARLLILPWLTALPGKTYPASRDEAAELDIESPLTSATAATRRIIPERQPTGS